jgi:hypothetical protein
MACSGTALLLMLLVSFSFSVMLVCCMKIVLERHGCKMIGLLRGRPGGGSITFRLSSLLRRNPLIVSKHGSVIEAALNVMAGENVQSYPDAGCPIRSQFFNSTIS